MKARHLALATITTGLGIAMWAHSDTALAPLGSHDSPTVTSIHAAASAPRLTVPRTPTTSISIAIDTAQLATRPATLVANDRRAWPISELLSDTYIQADAEVHARTSGGGDFLVRGDAIVVRRNNGELYVAWLDAGDGALADREKPAERIEYLVSIAIVTPPVETPRVAAAMTIEIDGKPQHTLTKDQFAAAATLQIKNNRTGTTPAIDIARVFGAEVIGVEASGKRVEAARPAPDARAVVFMNRHDQFKFAWVDAAGSPIGAKQREVSLLALRTR